MRAAIYARYSSDLQRDESITAQLRVTNDYCKKKGYDVVHEYCDEAKSGRSDDRPEFQNMVRDAKRKIFDVVVFHKIDRNSRNEYDYYHYKGQLKRLGVRLEYAEQQIDDSAEGQMMEAMLVGMAAYYSRNLANETRKGQKENALKCQFNGGVPPIGYDVVDKQYVINENEAAAVRLIFSLYLDGLGYDRISDELYSRGYRTKRGGKFSKNSLHDVLKNPRYVGTYVFGKVNRREDRTRNSHSDNAEKIVKPNAVPAIVSADAWNAVQAKMAKNKKASGAYSAVKRVYLLSGLIECAECHSKYIGKASTPRDKTYFWYVCGSQNRGSSHCSAPKIRSEKLERQIIATLRKDFLNEKSAAELTERLSQAVMLQSADAITALKSLENEKEQTDKKIANLLDAIENGLLNDVVKTRLQEASTRSKQLTHETASVTEKINRMKLTEADVKIIISAYTGVLDSDDLVKIKQTIETFVEKIVIRKDKEKQAPVAVVDYKIPVASWLVPKAGLEPARHR